MLEKVLGQEAVEEIYSSHSIVEKKLHSCADTYVTCALGSSWEELVHVLYDSGEMAAAKEARTFLQYKGGYSGISLIWMLLVPSPALQIIEVSSFQSPTSNE